MSKLEYMNKKELAIYILNLAYSKETKTVIELNDLLKEVSHVNNYWFDPKYIDVCNSIINDFNVVLKLIEKSLTIDSGVFLTLNNNDTEDSSKLLPDEIKGEVYMYFAILKYNFKNFESAITHINKSLEFRINQFSYIIKARINKELKPESGVFEKSSKTEEKRKEYLLSIVSNYKIAIDMDPFSEDGIKAGLELIDLKEFDMKYEDYLL
jgi:hypothetical protein